jgi:phosphoribosylaminoimidazole-succinocarboxamide synthase
MAGIKIGVLALQGAFAEHVDLLSKFPHVTASLIKTTADLDGVDGIIIPGGESTVIGKQLAASDLGDKIRAFSQQEKKPIFGTCAGFILLADEITKTTSTGIKSQKEGGQYVLGGMSVEIERNFFGRQINSFEAQVDSDILGVEPFHAVFIRAPAVMSVHGDAQVLASVEHAGKQIVVAVRQHNFLGTSFHPELTTDMRWHHYFVQMVRDSVHQMSPSAAVIDTKLPTLRFLARGKVRDIYTLDDKLLFVTTDRISAYDVIMANGIPNKGKILTALSEFWFKRLASLTRHHLITTKLSEMPQEVQTYQDQLKGRSMLVRKLEILPIEAIVRGYITGSAWKEYRSSGTVHGLNIPAGMQESEAFPQPIFTPSTKAEQGDHDENIHPSKVAQIIGEKHAARMEELALSLYTAARDYAATRGIIIADTKFEFGLDEAGAMVLVDEVLTPDSSRFWPADKYKVGQPQDSFDKQYLRDWLTANKIDKKEGVQVPENVVSATAAKYSQVYQLLTGQSWEEVQEA